MQGGVYILVHADGTILDSTIKAIKVLNMNLFCIFFVATTPIMHVNQETEIHIRMCTNTML